MFVKCNHEIPGEYLGAGDIYEVTECSRRDLYFRNQHTGGGTTVPKWQVERALASGALTELAA